MLVPVTVWVSFTGSWLFGEEAAVAGPETVLSGAGATLVPDRFPEETPEPRIVLKAQRTWQDPPPEAAELSAQTPLPPWYPPYEAGTEYDRDRPWFGYAPQRDLNRRRRGSWMDAICPLPKRRSVRPAQGNYLWQSAPPGRWVYPNAYGSRQSFGLVGPDAR